MARSGLAGTKRYVRTSGNCRADIHGTVWSRSIVGNSPTAMPCPRRWHSVSNEREGVTFSPLPVGTTSAEWRPLDPDVPKRPSVIRGQVVDDKLALALV